MSEAALRDYLSAATAADWQQVVGNGGPPCFHLKDDGRYCLRAQRWAGHDLDHDFAPLHALLTLVFASGRAEGAIGAQRCAREVGHERPSGPADTEPLEPLIYPVQEMVGLTSYIRPWASDEVIGAVESIVGGCRPEVSPEARRIAVCVWTIDGMLRRPERLGLTEQAQERLRELILEMVRQ